ncbi:hypothetical protein DEA8626_00799 [Defluviimonas aquaemixtae]|uniref:Uncharacterized protein n=1 Tax=Albidovulum aquaemixtae TaxID=1542388 RepID=A0A2R8B3W5_9RHOB|nr:hypothetical protein [Defluviimonas aquaemixtae]SPH17282.1 hypothetical protein DEA8626_00799 [Defluviimonas aquaemixtae]
MRALTFLMLTLIAPVLTGCARFPEVEAAESASVADAPYPALLPIDTLVAGTPSLPESDPAAPVNARAAALKARAERLRAAEF